MAVLLFLHFLRTELLLLHGVCLPVGNCSFSLPFVNNFIKNKGLSGDRHAYLLCDKLKVPAVVQIILTMYICFDAGSTFSVLQSVRENLSRLEQIEFNNIRRRIAPGKSS